MHSTSNLTGAPRLSPGAPPRVRGASSSAFCNRIRGSEDCAQYYAGGPAVGLFLPAERRERSGTMVTDVEQQVETQVPTIGEIIEAMDATWGRLEAILSRFAPAFEAGEDAGGWDPRHLLSHLVGSWQRAPVHSAFFLNETGRQRVPVQLHDDYWITEWEMAPLEAFVFAMKA